MLIWCIFATVAGLAASVPTDQCMTGRWTAWSECEPTRRCIPGDELKEQLTTFQMEATDAWDTGRERMAHIMMLKEQQVREMAACIAAGNCPSPMDDRPSWGAISCVDGLVGDYPCLNVDQLSFINFADQGYVPIPSDVTPGGNDVWGWTDPLDGEEYAIAGLRGATTFVRVTDPNNPVALGVLYSAANATTWRDMKVLGDYAYIVAEGSGHGLQVFDMKRLRGKMTSDVLEPDFTHNGFGNAHNVVANEETNFIYIVGATQTPASYPQTCRGGLYVLDVTDPLNPTYAGCFGDDGYVHDAQCVVYHGPDTRFTGNEICFCFNEDSFTIVDVTDKSNMYMISKTGYANYGYTHQGWATDDHKIVIMDDETDEINAAEGDKRTRTYVWDVSNLRMPELKSIYQASVESTDHNQYILGDLVFQSNNAAGLRILQLNPDTYTLTQVGYFDSFPSGTNAGFTGAWSVYPYFQSGTILLNTREYGLFMLRANMQAIRELIDSNTVLAERTRSREILHRASNAKCHANLEQAEQCLASTDNTNC